MHGLVALDAEQPPPQTRDPLERPAHAGRVRRDRVDDRARAADRPDRQPGAHRLHRAQAPVAETPRTGHLRADRQNRAPQGLRPPPPHRRPRHRRLGRIRNGVARRGQPPLERRGTRRPSNRAGLATDRPREPGHVRGDVHRHSRRGRRRRPGCRRARGRGRPARAAVDRARHLGRRVRRARPVRRRSPGPRPRVLPRGAERLAPDGRDAVGRRFADLARNVTDPNVSFDDAHQRSPTVATGCREPRLPPLPGRRAHPARRPRRPRRVRRPEPPTRPGSAHARRPRGRRVRTQGLARPDHRARRTAQKEAASRAAARAATCGPGSSPQSWSCHSSASQVDEGAAFGAAILGGVAAGVWPDVHAAVHATVRPHDPIEPNPDWIDIYAERREHFKALYPALRAVR